MMRHARWSGYFIMVAGLLVSPLALLAKGKLDYIAKFQQATFGLDVATYTDPDAKPDRIGLLGLAAGTLRNSFAFRSDEWPKLIDLTAKAAKAQSPGTAWTVMGNSKYPPAEPGALV